MRRIDKPSILVGALLGLGVALLLGSSDDGDARYQISAAGSGGEGGSHMVYIVDTETGHLWSRYGAGWMTDFGTPHQPTNRGTKVPQVGP